MADKAPGGHALGMIPSPADERDYQYDVYGTVSAPEELPETYLSDELPEARDQGATESCVAHASVLLRELQERHELGYYLPLSRQFAYHHRPDPSLHQGPGMKPREHLAVLRADGVPPESYWPGIDERGHESRPEPFDPVLEAARPHRIGAYASVNHRSILEMKSAIRHRQGVLIGLPVYSNFVPDSDGVIPGPRDVLDCFHQNRLYQLTRVDDRA